jgi:hypothetical protein
MYMVVSRYYNDGHTQKLLAADKYIESVAWFKDFGTT